MICGHLADTNDEDIGDIAVYELKPLPKFKFINGNITNVLFVCIIIVLLRYTAFVLVMLRRLVRYPLHLLTPILFTYRLCSVCYKS